MDNNTSARPCIRGAQTSRTAPWMPMPVEAWPCIAEALSGEWPRWAAIMDLRWHDDQTRMQRIKRIPSYRKLMKRWQWSEHHTRSLMADESAWKDARHSESRKNLAPISQESRTSEPKAGVQTESASQQSRTDLAAISTRADLHTYTPTQEHTPPKPPQGGTTSEEVKAQAVDKPVAAVDKPTEDTQPAQKPRKARTTKKRLSPAEVCSLPMPEALAAVEGYPEALAEFAAYRIEKKKPLSPRATKILHSKMLKALGAGCSGPDLLAAFETAILSGWSGVFPKAGAAQTPAPSSGAPSSTDPAEAPEAQAWERVKKALRLYGPQPPGTGADPWVFSNDPATAARYDRAILAAAKEAPTLPLAWRLLFNDGDSESRLWQGRRFMGAYRSTDRASAGVAA